jgi:hypothetical protein
MFSIRNAINTVVGVLVSPFDINSVGETVESYPSGRAGIRFYPVTLTRKKANRTIFLNPDLKENRALR